MKCCIFVHPSGSEPPLKANTTTWYCCLPTAQAKKTEMTMKRVCPSYLNNEECEIYGVEPSEKPITVPNQMEVAYSFDPWDDPKIRQIFSLQKMRIH